MPQALANQAPAHSSAAATEPRVLHAALKAVHSACASPRVAQAARRVAQAARRVVQAARRVVQAARRVAQAARRVEQAARRWTAVQARFGCAPGAASTLCLTKTTAADAGPFARRAACARAAPARYCPTTAPPTARAVRQALGATPSQRSAWSGVAQPWSAHQQRPVPCNENAPARLASTSVAKAANPTTAPCRAAADARRVQQPSRTQLRPATQARATSRARWARSDAR